MGLTALYLWKLTPSLLKMPFPQNYRTEGIKCLIFSLLRSTLRECWTFRVLGNCFVLLLNFRVLGQNFDYQKIEGHQFRSSLILYYLYKCLFFDNKYIILLCADRWFSLCYAHQFSSLFFEKEVGKRGGGTRTELKCQHSWRVLLQNWALKGSKSGLFFAWISPVNTVPDLFWKCQNQPRFKRKIAIK